MMAPILQSLIRGSSLVAELPLNIRGGACEPVQLSRIKENCLDSWLLCMFSVWHRFWFCFPHLINMSQKNWSSPSSGLHSHGLCECELNKTKAIFCFVCRSILQFWLLVFFASYWPHPWRKRHWSAAEMMKVKLYNFFPHFPYSLISISDQIQSQF